MEELMYEMDKEMYLRRCTPGGGGMELHH
uniref:Uncharacterized protein n=1 Tax=Arundo donax TaxID=35708 RepID=A0A0A9AEW7_ARUDO